MGRGARLTQVQLQAGGSWVIGLIEPGSADRERQIKGHDAARHCDVCRALKGYRAGELTGEQALGRAGWDRASEHERGLLAEIFGINRARVDADKIPYVPPKPIVPRPEPELVRPGPEIDALVDALIAGWTTPEADAEPELEAGAIPQEAILAAGLAEAETAYRLQLAREMYQAGHRAGFEAGYRQADADMAARWAEIARLVARGISHAELEERRWGPGGRFAGPCPGDFPGRGARPQAEAGRQLEAEAG